MKAYEPQAETFVNSVVTFIWHFSPAWTVVSGGKTVWTYKVRP